MATVPAMATIPAVVIVAVFSAKPEDVRDPHVSTSSSFLGTSLPGSQ
jgi:hypothetical protein